VRAGRLLFLLGGILSTGAGYFIAYWMASKFPNLLVLGVLVATLGALMTFAIFAYIVTKLGF